MAKLNGYFLIGPVNVDHTRCVSLVEKLQGAAVRLKKVIEEGEDSADTYLISQGDEDVVKALSHLSNLGYEPSVMADFLGEAEYYLKKMTEIWRNRAGSGYNYRFVDSEMIMFVLYDEDSDSAYKIVEMCDALGLLYTMEIQ